MKKIFLILTISCSVFASAQNYQWAKGIGGATIGNVPNNARCVTTDAAGNVYMTGYFQGTNVDFNPGLNPVLLTCANPAFSYDAFIAKYTPGGNCLWAKAILGTAGSNSASVGQSIAVDGTGSVYIIGWFSGSNVDFDPGPGTAYLSSAGSIDAFIAKYDNNGNYLWAGAIGSTTIEAGLSLCLDAFGNVYVTGRFMGGTALDFDPGAGVANLSSAGNFDIFFAKYTTSGNYLWAKRIGSTGADVSNSISADGAGNIYITGYFTGGPVDFDPGIGTANLNSSGSDLFFAKYDANGNYVWAKSVAGGVGHSIKADVAGNIWITGTFVGTNVDFDPGAGTALLSGGPPSGAMFFAKYDGSGNYLWAKSVQNAVGFSITKNTSGKVYVIGGFNGTNVDFDPGSGTAPLTSSGTGDIFFAKYDAAGNYIWAKAITPSIAGNYGNSIAVDGMDNVYIGGSFLGANLDFDPGPGTAVLSNTSGWSLYLAKYAHCSSQVNNPKAICTGGSYAINGHTYTASGVYNDTLYTAFGCDSIVVTQMTVSSVQPTVTIASNSVLCTGSSNTLVASGAVSYTWSTGPQTPSVAVTPSTVMQYIVSGTGASGCKGSDTISALLTPTLGISSKTTICKGEPVVITASGANTYTWSTGAQTASITPTLTTTTGYTVTGSFTSSPCQNQKTYTVNVNPCVGIRPMAASGLHIKTYPNPAKTELFYTVNSNGAHRYTITDFSGRVLAEGEKQDSLVRLDLSPYRPGLYVLTIKIGRLTKSSRFVIE